MRLFVALVPPPDVVAALPAVPAGVRPTPTEQVHLTLAFLGEVATADLLVPALGVVAGSPAPFLQLAGSGAFGSAVWLGVRGDQARLSRLARTAQDTVRGCGVALEHRTWQAHVTIGRGRPTENHLAGYEGPAAPWYEVRLVRSHLGGRAGARHETLASWTLPV
jgi:2'-5' RNA ligase